MTNPRLESLLKKISYIEMKLEQEQGRPYPNPLMLQSLKREKLKLRDDIRMMLVATSVAA